MHQIAVGGEGGDHSSGHGQAAGGCARRAERLHQPHRPQPRDGDGERACEEAAGQRATRQPGEEEGEGRRAHGHERAHRIVLAPLLVHHPGVVGRGAACEGDLVAMELDVGERRSGDGRPRGCGRRRVQSISGDRRGKDQQDDQDRRGQARHPKARRVPQSSAAGADARSEQGFRPPNFAAAPDRDKTTPWRHGPRK